MSKHTCGECEHFEKCLPNGAVLVRKTLRESLIECPARTNEREMLKALEAAEWGGMHRQCPVCLRYSQQYVPKVYRGEADWTLANIAQTVSSTKQSKKPKGRGEIMSTPKYFCKQEHEGECCLSPLAPTVCAPVEAIAEQIQSLKAKLKKCKDWIQGIVELPRGAELWRIEEAKTLLKDLEGE